MANAGEADRVMICWFCGKDIPPRGMDLHRKVELAISEGLAAARVCATVDSDRGAMRQLELFDEAGIGPGEAHSSSGPIHTDEELF